MSKLHNKHIELIEAVNSSATAHEHAMAEAQLRGFRAALDIVGGLNLVACDLHYLDQGIDRPMCCGVFLDWEPAKGDSGRAE